MSHRRTFLRFVYGDFYALVDRVAIDFDSGVLAVKQINLVYKGVNQRRPVRGIFRVAACRRVSMLARGEAVYYERVLEWKIYNLYLAFYSAVVL